MQAVLCKSFGPPESLTLEEVDDPQLGPGQVLIATKATALNYPDVLMIEGKYQSQPNMPFSPGGEFAGVITDIAEDVTAWQVGDEVYGGLGHGGFAEKIAAPAQLIKRKPASMSFAVAAGISTTYGTSYYALK